MSKEGKKQRGEGKKNRRNALFVAIIAAFVPLFIWYFSDDSSKEDINQGVIDNSKVNENEGTINKTNVGNNSGTVIGNQTNNYNGVETKDEGYAVKGSIELRKYLNKTKKIIINQNSTQLIELTFTGELIEIAEGSDIVQYNGGKVKLLINDVTCGIFDELNLDLMRPKSKNSILQELNRRIDKYARENALVIQNKILGCI